MADYTSINDLITALIAVNDGEQGSPDITIDNFSSLFYQSLTDALPSDFWQKLLNYIKTEGLQAIASSPIKESTFNEDLTQLTSVFNFINQNADLSDSPTSGVWANLVNTIKDNIDLTTPSGVEAGNEDYFWNESMNYLVAKFLETMNPATARILLGQHDGNDVYTSVQDIKNADAAWSFTNRWVKPLTNIDEMEYEAVRAQDAIKSVLKNSSEMQFTHTQSKADGVDHGKWIRLIMPKYLRKVEVEDLNRNFWVISQTLSAVCSYLFGEKSFVDILKRMLNELIQLWENVLYLWASVAMITQKPKITDVHVEVVPLPNSEVQSYIKFDNFGDTATTDWTYILERVRYIIDQYSDSNVIIIPQIREGNYKHNYYYRESYPGAIVFNRNNGQINYFDFVLMNGESIDGVVPYPVIDLKYETSDDTNYTYANKIGSVFEDEVYYQYYAPFSEAIAGGTSPYYAVLRTIPIVQGAYDAANDAIELQIAQFQVYDVAQQVVKQELGYTLSFNMTAGHSTAGMQPNAHQNCWTEYYIQDLPVEPDPDAAPDDPLVPPESLDSETLTDQPITKGFYMGECVSYQSLMALPTYQMEESNHYGQQLLFTSPSDVKDLLGG